MPTRNGQSRNTTSLKSDVVGPSSGNMTLGQLKSLQESLPEENKDYRPDYHEDTKLLTIADAKKNALKLGSYDDYEEIIKHPYAKQIFSLTDSNVKSILANPDMKSGVMANLSRSGGRNANIVTRDKFGNWFARERGGKNWVAAGDGSAVIRAMLSSHDFSKSVLDYLKA